MVDITAPVEAKLFGKWSMDDLMCNEISLDDYIATKEVYTAHTGQRYQARKFRKALCPIVERMCCSMMMKGRNNGKKMKAMRIIKQALEIVHLVHPESNPLQVSHLIRVY